jgi:cytochrome P450
MTVLPTSKTALFLVVLVVSVSFLILWQLFLKPLNQAKCAKEHGCKPPIFEHAPFPLNIKKALDLVQNYQNYTVLIYFHSLFQVYGSTYTSRVLWLDIVVTSDPDNIKHILQQRFWDFDIGPLRRPLFLPVTPHGVFNLDGEKWRAVRKMLRDHLAGTRSRMGLDILETLFQDMLGCIRRSGESVDMQDMFSALVTDYLSFLSVGQPLGALSEQQSQDDREIEEAFRYIKASIARFGQSGPLAWLYGRSRFRRACKLIQEYTGKFTTEAMERSQEEKSTCGRLCFVEAAAQEGYSFHDIRDQATSLYFAGDATSSLLSGTFWFLARNPYAFDRLKREILERFGSQAPAFGDLSTITYLGYVFNEGKPLFHQLSYIRNA